MPLPTADKSDLVHSAGKLVKQAPPPEIWQHFNAKFLVFAVIGSVFHLARKKTGQVT